MNEEAAQKEGHDAKTEQATPAQVEKRKVLTTKRRPGRPKGSRNKPKIEVTAEPVEKPVRPQRKAPKRAFMVEADEIDDYWRRN